MATGLFAEWLAVLDGACEPHPAAATPSTAHATRLTIDDDVVRMIPSSAEAGERVSCRGAGVTGR
ncbi:MAG TPA: hypothetical protein VE127_10555 [Solirubrobacteraceae bacterium]|nr:hypothetical protein [Solirubrobacteraceae bacterium]